MAEEELPGQNVVRRAERHGGTGARHLSAVHDPVESHHAEPELGESVPGEPEAGRRRVRSAGEQKRHVLPGGRDRRAEDGGRHDDLAERDTERVTVRTGHVHRLVERPAPETETVHADTGVRRARAQRRPDPVRVLLLRTSHGSRRYRGIGSVVRYGQYAGTAAGRIRVRGRHKHGQ